jgi:pyruvate dehydrogenase E2 component (dihydrolipoamide acetyltransferase)
MATEFFIPKLGQTVEEVTLVNWLVPEGTKVDFGQGVMEVETDKAIFPVEANAKGYLHIGPYEAGEVIKVLTVVAYIGKADETFASLAGAAALTEAALVKTAAAAAQPEAAVGSAATATPAEPEKVFASPRARKLADEKNVDLGQVIPTGGAGVRVVERDVVAYLRAAPKATPVAQRMATAEGVDLRVVPGSGPGGKIVKEDVTRSLKPAEAVSAGATALAGATARVAPTVEPQAGVTARVAPTEPVGDVTERILLKGVRAIIAERMGASVHTTARVTLIMEVDATEFVNARTRLKERVEKEWGFAPGYNDLLAKIVATALRQYPYMNARLTSDAIELMAHVNLGMAVDTERGLLVPVVRSAETKSIRQFGAEFRELVERARKGRSMPDDLSGGTFTITNLGMYAVEGFTPVINMPEAAILGVGRIAPKPAVHNNAIEIRQMMTLSLVFDHRLVDGAPAARFMQAIKQMVEEPYLLLGY